MKSILVLTALLLCTGAFAGEDVKAPPSGRQQEQTSTVTTTANTTSQASNAGNQQSIIFTSPGESSATVKYEGGTRTEVVSSGTTTLRNVPSVGGQALTSSNDTCMGSASGSLNWAGFGGSLGSTYVDENCKMLKNARELWNMGMQAAAMARMCMDADNRAALEINGDYVCPQTLVAKGISPAARAKPAVIPASDQVLTPAALVPAAKTPVQGTGGKKVGE